MTYARHTAVNHNSVANQLQISNFTRLGIVVVDDENSATSEYMFLTAHNKNTKIKLRNNAEPRKKCLR